MLQTKALYNLLRLNAAEDSSVEAEEWALEDMRLLSLDELFLRLQQQQVQMDKKSFLTFSEQCETPEELADLLLPDDSSENGRDPFYLAVFELWRRLVPDKQSLSIFCDELDHRIVLYDQEVLESDELIQDGLANLMEVFEENADLGADPKEILILISDYCAHDLESFLCDYITDLLDSGNALYAAELIEGFSPYLTEPLWFDFLRIRLASFTDLGDANSAAHRLLESGLELPLLLEMLNFLAVSGEPGVFKLALKKTLPLLSSEEDLIEVMRATADFYRRRDEEEKEAAVQKLLDLAKTGSALASGVKNLKEVVLL